MLRSTTLVSASSARLLRQLAIAGGSLSDLSTTSPATSSTALYCFFSSNAPAKVAFPSNLKVDPRSSFAPKRATMDLDIDDDDTDDDLTDDEADKAAAQEEDSDQDDDYEEEDELDDWFFEPATPTRVIPLPDRLQVPVYNFGLPDHETDNNENDDDATQQLEEPEQVGTLWLNPTVFGVDPIRIDLLKRAVDYHRSKKRGRRKAHTKKIGDIRGSGRKIRPQKGQGMARQGHKKAPHMRGGAKAHGPTNMTNYGNTKLNKKVRRKAIQNVLSQKLKEGNLILVNQFHTLPTHKTKYLAECLQPFGIAGRHGTTALMIDSYHPSDENTQENEFVATSYQGVPINLRVASANLHKLNVGNQLRNINVYDVLKHEKLVLTLEAVTDLEERLNDD
ncbi:protein L4 [Seminavis robusta]|uniref:Large ribosomal subunit protein uL4m n=1 Tax=Seminavis robusta TaxID=568900 RepID=A0A9N8DQG4_9STRA|nr:protein L4 [Seminavis robusta]|eukprot:Sro279_g106690.1 protein L4 (392) ;mRNA; f:9330-10505